MTTRLNAAEIASQIRREIETGDLRQHDRLPSERRLAERYGVARNTLREAILRLEEQGYVRTKPSSGTYVTYALPMTAHEAITHASPLELIDARFALEPHICRLCVMNGRREQFQELDLLCRQMEAAVNDPVTFAEADTAFHRLLAETAGNGLLIWVIAQINAVRVEGEWTRMRALTLNPATIADYNRQHRQILNAIRTREPERAAHTMKSHLETARLSLTRASET